MKKILLLITGLSLATVNQASAAYTVPAPITEWYFGTGGVITNENTTSPEVTAADIGGMLYGVFPEVTLEVGDTIAYTFAFQTTATHIRVQDLRWALFNHNGDYGTNFLGNNKQNWKGMWVDQDSLQTAHPGGNPFNFTGTAAAKVPPSFASNAIFDPADCTWLMFVEYKRLSETTYNMRSRLYNSLGHHAYADGVFDATASGNGTSTNSFNTFALYISANPNIQSIAVIPPAALVDTVQVEAAADGSANAPVPAQAITAGQSITSFAIARDGGGTFLENTYGAWWPNEANVPFDAASWGLTNITGDIVPSELVVQDGLRSAVFTGHASGTAQIVCYGNGTNLVASQTITVNGTAPDPTFNPPAGTYIGQQNISINVGLPGATIYYTTNGATPTTGSLVYTGPIIVPTDSSMTIKAFAAKAGNVDSGVVTASYATLTTPTWTSLAGGSWTTAGNWYQSYVPNGANAPADFSTLTLTSDTSVALDGNKTVGYLKFGDVGNTYNWTLDTGSGGALTLNNTTDTGIIVNNRTAAINAPIAGTKGLIKSGAGTLVLAAGNTYSGITVVSNGTLQIDSFGSIDTAVTIKGGVLNGSGFINNAITVDGGTLAAGTATTIGTLNVFGSVSVSAGGSLTMKISKTGGFASYDSLNASGVTFGGTLIVSNITSDATLLAAGDSFGLFLGTLSGGFNTYVLPTLPSNLSWDLSQLGISGTISVITGVAPPTFSPGAGGYLGAPTVTISCGTPGATIYYTTDGSPPNTGSPSGSSGLTVPVPANTASFTINAYAVASGLTDSAPVSAIYSTIDSPVWVTDFGGSWPTTLNWSNNVVASGANVTADFSALTLFSDYLVTLDGARTVGNLKFGDVGNIYSWTLDTGFAGPLTLAGSNAPVITVNSGSNNLISAVLAGSDGMVKAGPGKLSLSQDNTIGGAIVVNDGELSLIGANNNNGRLGSASSLTINSGATVSVPAANALSGANGSKVVPVTINAGGVMDGPPGASAHIWGLLTLNGGSLTGSGGGNGTFGTWNLENGVVVNGGTVTSTIDSPAVTLNKAGGTTFDVADGGTPSGVDLLVARPFIKALNVSDTGVIKNGAGTMKITGEWDKPYLGATIINSGRFLVDGSLTSTLTGEASPVTVNNGGTLGGTGTVGVVTFQAGSFAELTLGSPLTLTKELTVATVGTLPVVKVNLTNNVAPGTYTLAIYNVTNSAGAFDSTPTILSGSVAAGNVGTITTGSGLVSLVVGPLPTTAPGFTANGIQVSGGTVSLMATGSIGSTYKLWATTNVALTPVESTWTLLSSGPITMSPFTITDPGAVTNQQRFYLFSAP